MYQEGDKELVHALKHIKFGLRLFQKSLIFAWFITQLLALDYLSVCDAGNNFIIR